MELNAVPAVPTPLVSLPPDVPAGVQLVDEAWLAAQTSEGARLILLEPEDFARREARLEQAERRLEAEQNANRAVLAAVAELERRCAQSEKELEEARSQLQEAQSAPTLDVEQAQQAEDARDTRARELQGALASSQLELQYLQRELKLATRPLSKKILRRD